MSQQVPTAADVAAAQAQAEAVQIHLAAQRASMVHQARASFTLPSQGRASFAMPPDAAAARASFMLSAAAAGNPMASFLSPPLQQAAASIPQLNTMSMVATAKLANSTKRKDSNSMLVVRSSVPRFNVAGGTYTVAQWARKCVEDNIEFIVKLALRAQPKEKAIKFNYGDGETETLILLDEHINKMPTDLAKVPKIGIGVSSAFADNKIDEAKMAASGVLQPSDGIWDHLRFEQLFGMPGDSGKKGPKILFMHTCMTTYGDGVEGCRRVLQVKTEAASGKPYVATSFCPNPLFEQQVLALWKAQIGGGIGIDVVAVEAAAKGLGAVGEDDHDTVITFNPKELLILERAFDGRLRKKDMKGKATKWTEDDKIACQKVIARAQGEFKYYKYGKATPVAKKRKNPPSGDIDGVKISAAKGSPIKKTKSETDSEAAKIIEVAEQRAPTSAGMKKNEPQTESSSKAKEATLSKEDTKKEAPGIMKPTPKCETKETPKKLTTGKKKQTPSKNSTPAKSTPKTTPKMAAKAVAKSRTSSSKPTTPAKTPKKKVDSPQKRGRLSLRSADPPAKKTRSRSRK